MANGRACAGLRVQICRNEDMFGELDHQRVTVKIRIAVWNSLALILLDDQALGVGDTVKELGIGLGHGVQHMLAVKCDRRICSWQCHNDRDIVFAVLVGPVHCCLDGQSICAKGPASQNHAACVKLMVDGIGKALLVLRFEAITRANKRRNRMIQQ